MPSLDFKRSDRVSDLIHSEVAKIFSTEVRDPRLVGITIIKVELSSDLKKAFIYYSSSNSFTKVDNEDLLIGLDKVKGFIRSTLSKRLNMRRTPEINFKEEISSF
ncbi:MAG TPA: 30S ribosome-binding factor RbfA [Gammaproteobacteria bacterium]|jgi:ribosome-binding factor A|nr:30S ribosome-binding factor RbfA [Gammaproteobacteria bacterium]HIK72702.1 30S ribosome-binding factor RbfA [Gammaproteobacteria bacterium]